MSTPVTKDYLKDSLVRVCREIYKTGTDKRFKLRTRPYLRRTVTEIGVDKDDVPTGGAKWEDHIIERPWVIDVLEDAELTQAIQDAVDAIVQLYDLERTRAEYEVRQFNLWIAEKAISTGFDQSVINEGAQIFIADLENAPVSATVKIFLLGITPRRSSISIGKDLRIRKVCKDDLTLEYDVAFPPPQKLRIPHSIAEIRMDVFDRKDLLEHQFAAERLVSFLRLFRFWPVYLTSYSIIFPTITTFGTVSDPSVPMLGVKGNIIEPEDEECLEKLYQILLPMLPRNIVYRSGNDPVSIAYKLYSNALTGEEGSDWKFATAVAGLDALYVSGGVDQQYKLAHRAAKLLSFFGETPERVCTIVEESYDIRSRVFHGDNLKAKQINAIPEYLSFMYEYLRKSILLFLFLAKKESLDKKSIIDYVDDSLIGVIRSDGNMLIDKIRSVESKIKFSFKELGMKSHVN